MCVTGAELWNTPSFRGAPLWTSRAGQPVHAWGPGCGQAAGGCGSRRRGKSSRSALVLGVPNVLRVRADLLHLVVDPEDDHEDLRRDHGAEAEVEERTEEALLARMLRPRR